MMVLQSCGGGGVGSHAPPAPAAVTMAATSVSTDNAVLNGVANPRGLPTTAWFEWGTDVPLSSFTKPPDQSIGSGTADSPVIHKLTGLRIRTTYYYRLVVFNSAGTAEGSITSFATAAPFDPPTVQTLAATSITITGAVLNGDVNPNGLATNAWFECETDPTLSTFSVSPTQAKGSGMLALPFNQSIFGLSSYTTYYFRAVASNTAGESKGAIVSFSTAPLPPVVNTNPATSITSGGAVLNGDVNPNGLATNAWFEWGTDPNLSTFSITPTQAKGSGTTALPFNQSIFGLSSYTTYYFRAAASNTAGESKGAIKNFPTGELYIAIGDSITAGSHDDISTDGIGDEPILGDSPTASKG